MTDDVLDYRPTRSQAFVNLERKAQELLAKRDLLELFDVRGLPKPMVPTEEGKWARSPLFVLHSLGVDQARDPAEWRAHLNNEFPARPEILKHRHADRERLLRLALSTHLLSIRQTKVANAELRDIAQERLAA